MSFQIHGGQGSETRAIQGREHEPHAKRPDTHSLQNRVSLPIDPGTGAASGKPAQPDRCHKGLGCSLPQFYQALVNSEVLQTVAFTFNRVGSNGKVGTYFTINLTNAVAVEIRQYVGGAPGLTDNANALEDISLTYQKIEVADTDAKTSASDDWLV